MQILLAYSRSHIGIYSVWCKPHVLDIVDCCVLHLCLLFYVLPTR